MPTSELIISRNASHSALLLTNDLSDITRESLLTRYWCYACTHSASSSACSVHRRGSSYFLRCCTFWPHRSALWWLCGLLEAFHDLSLNSSVLHRVSHLVRV